MPEKIPLWYIFLLESQSYCNLACRYCTRNNDPTRSRFRNGEPIREMMPAEKVYDLINQAAEMGYRGWIGFHFFSEPTCDPRLVSFVKYAKRKGMLPMVTSNGVLLTDELCKQLEGTVDRLAIGLANTSEAGRKKPEAFWRARFPTTRRLVVTTRGNTPDPWDPVHFFPQKERLRGAIDRNINSPCQLPRQYLSITYDGEMALCCDDLLHDFDLGNAFEKSLEELWWSEKHVEIVKALSVPSGRLKYPYCRTCPYSDFNIEANYRAWYVGTPYFSIKPSYAQGVRR